MDDSAVAVCCKLGEEKGKVRLMVICLNQVRTKMVLINAPLEAQEPLKLKKMEEWKILDAPMPPTKSMAHISDCI